MNTPRVLNVGQCGYDNGKISRFLRETYQAQSTTADSCDEALAALRSGKFELVLVNRIFDADGSAGCNLIRAIKSDPALADIPTMLVSNYPEAQADAIALGALPGFGKAEIGKARVNEILAPTLRGVPSKS
jgi:hypothetical protein